MTATRSLSASLQHLNRTLLADEIADLPDTELVGRFVEGRDEAAFTALVRRYGLLVFGVCRRVLRNEQDAEDAFQATFLVLARDAASVQRAGIIGNWLYGVAHNVARKAKTARHRREIKEQTAATRHRTEALPDTPDDLPEILDGELGALPDKYRAPIVLCDLMGLTTQQAATEVGCPPKTLGTRLSRGRSLLARRLTRRGVTLSVAALTAALAPSATASAAVPPRLLDSAARGATDFVTGSAPVSQGVAALTTGVSNVMVSTSIKYALLASGFLAVAGLSTGPLLHHLHAAHTPRTVARTTAGATTTEKESKPPRPDDLRRLHDYFISLLPFHGAEPIIAAVRADDKKDDKPKPLTGVWMKKDGEVKITFEKDGLKISPHNKDEVILLLCEYTHDKDGFVKAKVTGHEGSKKAVLAEKLPVGTEFTFKWKTNKDMATLEDVKGDKIETFKSHLEGDFEEK